MDMKTKISGLMDRLNPLIQQYRDLLTKTWSEGAKSVGSIGIDIGTYAVKAVRLESGKDGARITGFAVEKIADHRVADALSKVLVRMKASAGQTAVIGLSGQGVVSRYVELPLMNRSDLDSAMKFEIEKYVPFALTDVATDHAVIHEMKDKAKMSVLIVAAKNDSLQKKCQLAREVNLNLKAVDLECLALANFFNEFCGDKKKGAVGIIHLGRTVSHINILVDGVPYLSRDIFIGGEDINKKMVEVLGIDPLEAEKLKCEPGNRSKELALLWDHVLSGLAAEIRVSLDYFEARINKSVDKIFITGGSSRLSGLEAYLNHALGAETQKLDYADRFILEESLSREDFKDNSDLLGVAIGLALR
jgi:type IV pilus assembly protein PilM